MEIIRKILLPLIEAESIVEFLGILLGYLIYVGLIYVLIVMIEVHLGWHFIPYHQDVSGGDNPSLDQDISPY